jgi:RHS repeat-associated protein
MFKRIVWLSIFLAVSAFAGQVVIKSGVLKHQDVAIVGESTWDKLANASSQTTQELWNSTKSFLKSASFLLPDAVIQSLSSELPTHDATVGSTPGEAGVSGGSASYSIPIALPPGRKGMQPSVSLSYSSKGGNGIAGMGWNVSGLSSVHRCPQTLEQDGQIRAVDYSLNDRLCFDGQRLVATSGTYGALNTKYSTEIDSFARITQLGGDLNAINSYFKVEYKSGEIAYFGGTTTAVNNARVIAGGVTKPLNWLIARSEDRLGNNIVYTYSNFTNGEVQPTAIFYTGFNTTQGDRKVEFVYEARPTTSGANDQSSSYLAGGLTRQTQRLLTIKTWVGTEAVREYRLNYGAISATSGRSLLRSVQECAMLNAVATCRRPITFAWAEGEQKFAMRKHNTLESWGVGVLKSIGDVDGDGASDLVWRSSDGPVAQRMLSLAPDRSLKWYMDLPSSFDYNGPGSEFSTDFDMDGRSDFTTLQNGQMLVYFWRGMQPSNASNQVINFADAFNVSWNTGLTPTGSVKIQDMNADGRADIIMITSAPSPSNSCAGLIKVFRNNVGAAPGASGGFTEISSQCVAGIYSQVSNLSYWFTDGVSRIEDFNGDGLPDIWLVSPTDGSVGTYMKQIRFGQLNPSYSFTTSNFSALFTSADPMTAEENTQGLMLRWLDVNGDGLLDMVYARSGGYWTIRLNTGGKLGPRILTTAKNGLGGKADPLTGAWVPKRVGIFEQADSDNDGREEMLIPGRFAVRICTNHYPEGGGGGQLPLANTPTGPLSSEAASPGGVAPLGAATDLWRQEEFLYCPGLPSDPRPIDYLIPTPAPGASYDTNGDGTVNALDQIPFESGPLGGGGTGSSEFDPGLSKYFMNAVRFIETAPNQYTVEEVPTGQIGGSAPLDLYGDGFEDALLRFECFFTAANQCVLAGEPGNWPNGDPIRNGGQFYVNEYAGPNAQKNADNLTPKAPDMLASVTDGIGNKTEWTYYPLSSKANRNLPTDTPLYTVPTDPALRYVDARHTYFNSSMQVVAEMTQTNGIGSNVNKMRYSYSEAMYNTQGRGFQGFRKIIEEDMSKDTLGNPTGLRTTTTFHQKYPLTSRVEKTTTTLVSQTEATAIPLNYTLNLWRCNRANRADTTACGPNAAGTNPVRFPFQDWQETVNFNLAAAQATVPFAQPIHIQVKVAADTANCDTTFSSVSGYDANGNLTAQTTVAADYGANGPNFRNYVSLYCSRTRNTFAAADTTNWWLDKLTQTQQTNSIVHGVDQPLPSGVSNPVYTTNTAYTWNTNHTLASETFQNGIANQQKLTAYTYPASNNYGLPLSVTVTASGDQNAGGRTTSTTYSSDGYFPLSVTNALGHTATTAVRLRDGLPISVTDPNGLRTLTTYDAFSQAVLVKARGALDTQYLAPDKQVAATWCTVANSINSCGLSDAAYQLTSVQDGSPTSISTHDKLGRVLRTHSKLLDGTLSVSDTQYNNKGQTIAQSLPYRSGDTPLWTYFVSYDQIGRLTAKSTPQQHPTRGDMVTTYTYNGDTTTIKVCGSLDLDNSQCLNLSRSVDVLGRYVETTDALGGITKFWFDANGQALVLQDVKGNQIKATYNAIGQRTSVNDPNQGISNFIYNALGEVLTQTDARAITSTTSYDKLGRKMQFSVTADENGDGVNDAIVDTWSYDPVGAKGQLSQSKRTINAVVERQENNSFDALIRPSAVVAVQNTGSGTTRTYSSEFQYDTYYGRVLAQFFPNGEGEQFIFNQYGYETEQRNATNASIYRQIVTVDSTGRPTRELKGFNLSTDTAYWPNGQTKSIIHQKDGVTIRKINYAYDVFGNVATQELNNGMAGNTLESFSYDKLHRLTQSTRTGAAATTVTYGYDAAGNFNFKSDFSQATGIPYKLSTGGLGGGGANAVKSVTLINGTTRSYGYDASGNMTADDAGFTAKYDHANLATKLQRGAVINYFIYDANNAKARQTGTDGSKVYLGGYEDWITAGQTKVSLGNYAQVTNGTGGRVLNYFLTDRLGSVDAVTDGNGVLVETRGYDAFGAPRTGTWGDATQLASTAITPKGFTSHEHLNSVQLIHMNGRMYDYQLGRFLGVDPFIQMPTNSQSLNPYSYIMNNPLSGTDPTGYQAVGSGNCTAGTANSGGSATCMNAPEEPAKNGPSQEGPKQSEGTKAIKNFMCSSGCSGSAGTGQMSSGVGGKKDNGAPGQTTKTQTSLTQQAKPSEQRRKLDDSTDEQRNQNQREYVKLSSRIARDAAASKNPLALDVKDIGTILARHFYLLRNFEEQNGDLSQQNYLVQSDIKKSVNGESDSFLLGYSETKFTVSGFNSVRSGTYNGADINYMIVGMTYAASGDALNDLHDDIENNNRLSTVMNYPRRWYNNEDTQYDEKQTPNAKVWGSLGYEFYKQNARK